jgi:hypothetical protein
LETTLKKILKYFKPLLAKVTHRKPHQPFERLKTQQHRTLLMLQYEETIQKNSNYIYLKATFSPSIWKIKALNQED